MSPDTPNTSYFSQICIERCGGICCDPWWGIISFPIVKEGRLGSASTLKAELIKAIKARAERIIENYVTSESPKRQLFKTPEKYNITLKEIRASGSTLSMTILAVFAFRCLFVSKEGVCTIHPSVLGGSDIRPPHCGYLGMPKAMPGERGYCRIIHAAVGDGDIDKEIEVEKATKARFLSGGVDTVEEAAEKLTREIMDYCSVNASRFVQEEARSVGRNDPCHCGSGKKFKKCHGARD